MACLAPALQATCVQLALDGRACPDSERLHDVVLAGLAAKMPATLAAKLPFAPTRWAAVVSGAPSRACHTRHA